MNSKELVRNMIAFLNERHDMDCATLRQRFAVCYGMSEDEAKEQIGKSMPDIAVGWMRLCPTLKLRLES